MAVLPISMWPAGSQAVGGTGVITQSGVSVKVTFDTMAYQAASAVAITGGTIAATSVTTPLIQGGTGSGDDLRLTSTSNATKGTVNIGNATQGFFWNETNSRMAIGADVFSITVAGASTGVDLSIHNDEAGEVCQTVFRYATSAVRSACWFGARSRGDIGAETIVQSGDRLVTIQALGYDGTDYEIAAQMLCEVDGTPGNNDMPGRWVFLLTPDGSATPTESLRITAALVTSSVPMTLGTSNAFTCGSIELGAASDTTIARSAAGVIAVEGVPIYSNIPQNSQSAAYTTVLADAQKHILHPTADNNARTFTIDSNANVAYPIGTAITFVNQINTVTIAITADTMTLAGAGTTGSRTLAANGIATALKIASTSWIISGTGLT